MPLHEKRFNPQGKLVVAKADGLRFAGRSYAQGEAITDPILTMRKARQLYFQNKLCYDYELADKAVDREEAARAQAIAQARFDAENAEREAKAAADAERARVAAEAAAERHAHDVARAIEQANIAAGRVAPEAVIEPAKEPVSEASPEQPESVETMVLSPEDSVTFVEAVIEQPAASVGVEPAPRRRRRTVDAGDTSEATATEAAPQE